MSAIGEYILTVMQEIYEQVKARLYERNLKYKTKENFTRREKNFEVGYLVLEHLKKEIFPKGECNKLK